jgi:hypothetical protein
MDLSFFRRAEQRFASRTAAKLDHGMLVAMLRTQQSASPAACAEAAAPNGPGIEDPLVELLLAGPGWRQAAAQLRGAFRPGLARKGAVN